MMRAGRAAGSFASVVLAFFLHVSAATAAPLTGSYDGIGDAANMVLTLQQADRRVVGRLTLSGADYTINGERTEADSGGAQGALRISGAGTGDAAFFHIEERPLGLQFLFIPARPDGTPDLARSQEFSFLKRGVRPTLPADAKPRFKPAPPADETVDIVRFIDEFRGWDPRDTARLYAGLDDRSRGLLLLYDHATAELLWRMCMAEPAEGSIEAVRLVEMFERQQTDCATYLPVVERARESDVFREFLRRAQFQFELVRATVMCDRGLTAQGKCADVSALGAPLILRWRSAQSIMASMAPRGGGGGPDADAAPMAEAEPALSEPAVEPAVAAAETPAVSTASFTLPLPRPSAVEEEISVSDFEPDIETVTAGEARKFKLPLPRPR